MKNPYVVVVLLVALVSMAGCTLVEQVFVPEGEPEQQDPLRLPTDLDGIVDTLGDLGLPDVSGLAELPGLDSLPLLETIPGGIVYRGPAQRTISAGNYVPGTDILLVRTGEDGAEFEIDGLRSVRVAGDSLDYDGEWPTLPGVTYSTRFRIYRVGEGRVRIAGVHQLGIPDIAPQIADAAVPGTALKFPFLTNVASGETIPGTTYGYVGVEERGAELSGLAEDEYPFRKTGDSVQWRGYLRQDIPVEYIVRAIHFDENAMQVGGLVSVALPMRDEE